MPGDQAIFWHINGLHFYTTYMDDIKSIKATQHILRALIISQEDDPENGVERAMRSAAKKIASIRHIKKIRVEFTNAFLYAKKIWPDLIQIPEPDEKTVDWSGYCDICLREELIFNMKMNDEESILLATSLLNSLAIVKKKENE